MDRDWSIKKAGGFIIQLMPETDEETISKLENNLKKISSITSLLEEGKLAEDILEMLLGEIEILDKLPVNYNCNCTREKIRKALISIGLKDLKEMLEEDKGGEVKCFFCNSSYVFNEDDLKEIIQELS